MPAAVLCQGRSCFLEHTEAPCPRRPPDQHHPTTTTSSCKHSLQDSLQLLQDPNSQGEAIRNGFILLGFLIFFRVWCYYALRSKTAGL